MKTIFEGGEEYLHPNAAAGYVGLSRGGFDYYRTKYPVAETQLVPYAFASKRVRFKRRDLDRFRAWLRTPRPVEEGGAALARK